MSKFTKTLVAAAIAGFVSTSVTAGCIDGNFATPQGKQAKLKITGQKCDKSQLELDMELFLECSGGSNSGTWESTIFDFGLEGNGQGLYIASKPEKKLTMDQNAAGYDDFQDYLADYVFENCSKGNPDEFNYDTTLEKFEAKVSKNGEKVQVQWKSTSTYLDGSKDKDRKVKSKLKAKLDRGVDPEPPLPL